MGRLSRRQLLRLGAGTAVAASSTGLLSACLSPSFAEPTGAPATGAPVGASPSAAARPSPTASKAPPSGEVNFFGWTPGSVNMTPILDEFKKQYPAIKMNWTGYTSAQYQQQMTTIFVAGVPRVDCLWLREEAMGGWIRAGYIQSIEGTAQAERYRKLAYPGSIEDGTFDGKLYGLPYYTSWLSFVVNTKMLQDAGVAGAPKTWDEFKTSLQKVKSAGILAAPLTIAFQSASDFFEWPALVYASGGNFFDESLEPVFDGKDKVALEVLQRLVDLKDSGLLDPKSLGLIGTGSRDTFMAGQSAMSVISGQYFIQVSDPKASKVATTFEVANIPSLTGKMEKTIQYTRQYGIGAKTNNKDAALQVVEFMSGFDTTGAQWGQEYLMGTAGLQSAYPAVNESAKMQALQKTWFNGKNDLVAAQLKNGRARQGLKASWFTEWDTFNQSQIQDAILGKTKPADALAASAKKARDLKKAS